MKRTVFVAVMSAAILLSGCGSMTNLGKGALIGGGGGAVLGAGVGALIGGGKGAAIGAGVGAAVGAGTGMLIGAKMDKQKKELEKIQGATVEEVVDKNNLKAIKVTFADGILFATGKSELNASSRTALTEFAKSLAGTPDTDLLIQGHTDNTGSREANTRVANERANSVANFLKGQGIAATRIKTEGLAFDVPVADNNTAAGRAANRRVEVYISANEQMIKQAEAGTLK